MNRKIFVSYISNQINSMILGSKIFNIDHQKIDTEFIKKLYDQLEKEIGSSDITILTWNILEN